MYEPIVSKKPKIRSLRGTPAGKLNVVVGFMMVTVPFGACVLFCLHVVKRKKLINEFEGITQPNKLQTLDELFSRENTPLSLEKIVDSLTTIKNLFS